MAASDPRIFPRTAEDFRTVFAMTVWSAIVLIACVVISRRVDGVFRADLGTIVPCLAATAALVFSLMAHAFWSAANSSAAGPRQGLAVAVTLIPPLALAAALWNSPSMLIGWYLAVLSVLSALATIVIRDLSRHGADRSKPLPTTIGRPTVPLPTTHDADTRQSAAESAAESCPPEAASEAIAILPVGAPLEEPLDDEAGECDPSVLQSITRRQLADGAEEVEGSIRAHFGPGERLAVAHVAFVPPLSERPRAECQALVDFDGRVRIAVAEAYGLRIEARRSESDSAPASIDVGFVAHVRRAQSAAA